MADFLMGMGFDREAVDAALAAVGDDNVEMAATLLLQQGSPGTEHELLTTALDDATAIATATGEDEAGPWLADSELAAVVELGFGTLAASKALIVSNGDGQQAARWLLEEGPAVEDGSGELGNSGDGAERWLCSPTELARALRASSSRRRHTRDETGLEAVRLQLEALCGVGMGALRPYEGSRELSEALLGFLHSHSTAAISNVGQHDRSDDMDASVDESAWRSVGTWVVRALNIVGTRTQLLCIPTVQILLGCITTVCQTTPL